MIRDWIKRRLEERQRAAEVARRLAEFDLLEERDIDKDENAETQPPAGESINIWCLWVVEFYGPSQIPALIRGLTNLGLANPRHEYRDSAVEFMQEARQRGDTVSWMALGTVRRTGDTRSWDVQPIRADLPIGVELAIGTMHQILPSVTAVAMQFVFDDFTSGCLQEILQEMYATQLRPTTDGGRQYITPIVRKRERLAEARASLRARCEFWFSRHLPGVFSASPFQTRFPACELVTLSKGVPFTDSDERHRYLEVLGLDRTWNAWKCEKIPALRMGWHTEARTGLNYLMIGANEGELSEWAKEHPGYSATPRGLLTSQLGLDRWLVGWSLRSLLEEHSKSILALRDKALHDAAARWFSKALQETQKQLLTLRPDVLSFAEDLTSLRKSGELFRTREHKFEALSPHGRSNRELLELVLEGVHDEAERLSQGLRSATEDFMTSVNLRHQAALTWYTLVILILTVLLVVFELQSRSEKSEPRPAVHSTNR